MDGKVFEALECSLASDFRHIAKHSKPLSCGHLVCNECLTQNKPRFSCFSIQCSLCCKQIDVDRSSIELLNQTKASECLFEHSFDQLISILRDKMDETIDQFKHIHSKDFTNDRIENIKEMIDIRVESLKVDLDNLRDALFVDVEKFKEKLVIGMNEQRLDDEVIKYRKFLEQNQISTLEMAKSKELFFKCQDLAKKLDKENRKHLKSLFPFNFKPSEISLGRNIIGSFIYNDLNIESNILNTQMKNDLVTLCEFDANTKWTRLYRAAKDGYGADNFHYKCDNHKGTLVVIQSKDEFIFGGYTSQLWNHTGDFKPYKNEFIFSLTNPFNKPTKINGKLGSDGIMCHYNKGPVFGRNNGLYICTNSLIRNDSYSTIGHSNGFTDQAHSYLLNGTKNFYVYDIEVFKIEKIQQFSKDL